MRKWTIAILLCVLGLLLGVFASGWLLRPKETARADPPACGGAAVIVLNQKIDPGTAVGPDMLSTTTVRHELMLGDLIGEEFAEFIVGLPLKSSLRRGDLLRWSDFATEDILEEIAKPEKIAPRKVHAVFTRGQILPSTPIRAYNAASRRDEKYFDCMVFLSGPKVMLEQIECVEYTLHETFDDPQRKVCRPEADANFSAAFSAWGTFDIPIRITMQDGAQMEWVHGLHF